MKPFFVQFHVSDECTYSYPMLAPVYAESVEEVYTYLSDNVRSIGQALVIAQEQHRQASVAYQQLAREKKTKACEETLPELTRRSTLVRTIQATQLLTDHEGCAITFENIAVQTPQGYELDPGIQIRTMEDVFQHAVHVQVPPTQRDAPSSDFQPDL